MLIVTTSGGLLPGGSGMSFMPFLVELCFCHYSITNVQHIVWLTITRCASEGVDEMALVPNPSTLLFAIDMH